MGLGWWVVGHVLGAVQDDQPMRLRAVVLPPATLRVLDRIEQACRGPPQQGAA
jgi:hypothetical protein